MPAAQRRVGATCMTSARIARRTLADNVAYLNAVAAHVRTPRVARMRALGFSQGSATVFRWAVLGKTRLDAADFLEVGDVPDDVDIERAAERLAGTTDQYGSGCT